MPAYLAAAAAITGLNTAYSAAVLKSWRRAGFIGVLLTGLYAVLYVLLSLEAYSLLIGSLMLFVALAAVMYLTRNLNWGGRDRRRRRGSRLERYCEPGGADPGHVGGEGRGELRLRQRRLVGDLRPW